MIELIMVMVIIGILSASIMSRLNFASHDAAGYAEVIKSSIRLAQKLAIAKRDIPITVTFPVNPCADSPVNGVQVTGEQCYPVPNGVVVTGFSILFDGLGRATNVGPAALAITIFGGEVNRLLCFEPETGYVYDTALC